jgi:hypothetical protein
MTPQARQGMDAMTPTEIRRIIEAHPAAALVALQGDIRVLGPRTYVYAERHESVRRNLLGFPTARIHHQRGVVFARKPNGGQINARRGEEIADFAVRVDAAWVAAGWTLVDELPVEVK